MSTRPEGASTIRPATHARVPASPGGAALRSAIVPGWGQWAAGRPWRGLLIVLVAFVLIAIPVLGALRLAEPLLLFSVPKRFQMLVSALAALGPIERPLMALLSVSDWTVVLRAVVAANLLVGAFRLWSAWDAATCARRQRCALAQPPFGPSGVSERLGGVAAAFAALIVVLPHLAVLGATYLSLPFFSHMLVSQSRPAAALTTQAAQAAATAVADTTRPFWDGNSRLNVLLLGSDRRPDEAARGLYGNSDTILVVSVEPQLRGATFIQIPRDVWLDIPHLGPEKINAAYREGGPDLAVQVVSDLLQIPIHRWASIDTQSFTRVVDSVGGVVVDVERPIRDDEFPTEDYSLRRVFLPAGLQWLDGERAMWFVRSRHGSNDFDRAGRQQALLLALRERLQDRAVLSRLPAIAETMAGAVQSNVTPRDAVALARLAASAKLCDGCIKGLVLAPPFYGTEVNRPEIYMVQPNVAKMRAAVAQALGSTSAGPIPAGPLAIRPLPVPPIGIVGQGGGGPADDSDAAGADNGTDTMP